MATAQTARKQPKPRVEIGAEKVRDSLGNVIDRVRFGSERLAVTRHGTQVIGIVSIDDLETLEALDRAKDDGDNAADMDHGRNVGSNDGAGLPAIAGSGGATPKASRAGRR